MTTTPAPRLTQEQLYEHTRWITFDNNRNAIVGHIAALESELATTNTRLAGALSLVPGEVLCGELQQAAARFATMESELAQARENYNKLLGELHQWTRDYDIMKHEEYEVRCQLAAVSAERDRMREALSNRDRDWILAMAAALGTGSNFHVPIVPEPEPFTQLFAEIRAALATKEA